MKLEDQLLEDYDKYQKLYNTHSEHDCKENECDIYWVHYVQAVYSYISEVLKK